MNEQVTMLALPVPPALEEACGYTGQARHIALYWGAGDEVSIDDGRVMATGEWEAYLTFVQHWSVAPALRPYDLGSSEAEATHWLLLDRELRQLSVAPVAVAKQIVRQQWGQPDKEQVFALDSDAWLRLVEELNVTLKSVSFEQVIALQREQQERVIALHSWLDSQATERSLR